MIQRSAINNFEIVYKDPITLQTNFEWCNWKDFIKIRFLPCPGITNWHVVKIPKEGDHILVADHICDPFREVRILNEAMSENDIPEKIIPKGLSEDRQKELNFFFKLRKQ